MLNEIKTRLINFKTIEGVPFIATGLGILLGMITNLLPFAAIGLVAYGVLKVLAK